MPTNQDLIRMHLEQFIEEYPYQNWHLVLAYCIGYYGNIDMDILAVVKALQEEGKIE